jgi:hypothetical protein
MTSQPHSGSPWWVTEHIGHWGTLRPPSMLRAWPTHGNAPAGRAHLGPRCAPVGQASPQSAGEGHRSAWLAPHHPCAVCYTGGPTRHRSPCVDTRSTLGACCWADHAQPEKQESLVRRRSLMTEPRWACLTARLFARHVCPRRPMSHGSRRAAYGAFR